MAVCLFIDAPVEPRKNVRSVVVGQSPQKSNQQSAEPQQIEVPSLAEVQSEIKQSESRYKDLNAQYNTTVDAGDQEAVDRLLKEYSQETKRAAALRALEENLSSSSAPSKTADETASSSKMDIQEKEQSFYETENSESQSDASPNVAQESSENRQEPRRNAMVPVDIPDTTHAGIYWNCDGNNCYPKLRENATWRDKLEFYKLQLGSATDVAIKNPSDTLDAAQRGIDGASLIPFVGTAADGANTLISGLRYTFNGATGNWEVANEHRNAAVASGLGIIIPGLSGATNKAATAAKDKAIKSFAKNAGTKRISSDLYDNPELFLENRITDIANQIPENSRGR